MRAGRALRGVAGLMWIMAGCELEKLATETDGGGKDVSPGMKDGGGNDDHALDASMRDAGDDDAETQDASLELDSGEGSESEPDAGGPPTCDVTFTVTDIH